MTIERVEVWAVNTTTRPVEIKDISVAIRPPSHRDRASTGQPFFIPTMVIPRDALRIEIPGDTFRDLFTQADPQATGVAWFDVLVTARIVFSRRKPRVYRAKPLEVQI